MKALTHSLLKFRLIGILSIMLVSQISYAQEETNYNLYINNLDECIEAENYQKGLEYVEILQDADSLPNKTLVNCTDCYILLEKYEECIAFCDHWLQRHPQCRLLAFAAALGECYYRLDDKVNAIDNLSFYIEQMEQQNLVADSYYYGILANALLNTYEYKEAEEMFERYFDVSAQEDGLTRATLHLSKYKKDYGKYLYKYAYNCFFQGKEKEGLEQLILAKECGNKNAIEDYEILSNCPTFAKDFEYPMKTINEFRSSLYKYDIYEKLSNNHPAAFWSEVVSTNASLNELKTALQKEKLPSSLSKALGELNESKPFIEYHLYECNPFERGELENSLEQSLCGGKSFFEDLRVYPADEANAFATPSGEIYLTSSMVHRLHFNKTMLLGVCAHETAHFLCHHSLVGLWKQAKKDKRNEVMAEVAASINTLANGYAAAMSGVKKDEAENEAYWNTVKQNNNNIFQSFQEDAFYFRFKYMRSQEIEADILAYRFLEHIGIGGYAYIIALQLFGDSDIYVKAEKGSDHPTTNFRVGLLKYLYNQDHNPTNDSTPVLRSVARERR